MDAYLRNENCSEVVIEKEFAPNNPVYVVAILADIPGMKYKLSPIVMLVANEV